MTTVYFTDDAATDCTKKWPWKTLSIHFNMYVEQKKQPFV